MIVDTDLADVSDWDESGELIFKASAELTPEQKVAVSEIIKESLGGQHAQDQALRHGHPRQAAKPVYWSSGNRRAEWRTGLR